ncbi:hypothetical protein GCM10023189_23070 [Nibrella saemangeumensis]|uniref:FHA domain-containing protein n=1 Tax=Nibrella saemangeumensis TaxID=1084526 RepID=A0ABP8MUQ1_9BACT
MKGKPTFWQRIGLHDWFLNRTVSATQQPTITPDNVYHYILDKFNESIGQLSFANRVVFYHEYIICFNPDDYQDFMDAKKGIFGLIVHESVKQFYQLLRQHRTQGKTVEPSSRKWVFRFVSHPDYARGDIGFIGRLLPGSTPKEENLRVTFIPRQTGIAETLDINQNILQGFNFYSEGYYEVPYAEELHYDEKQLSNSVQAGLARLETILPDKAYSGKKIEFLMNSEDIVVSGQEETRDSPDIFRIPSDWVNTPHLRIRYSKADNTFYLASFGEKTLVNEKEVTRSDVNAPSWVELPINSRIMLNGIVGINIFKPV